MTDLCEPAVEMQALKMSQSLLLVALAATCHGWVLDCGLCRERVGEGHQQTMLVRAVTQKICATLCSESIALWVSAAEMAEIRDWTLLKLHTGTFRNYWAWARLLIGKKETQYLADRWGVGPFSQVGSSGSSFCSEFLWMKLENQ